MTHTHTHVRMHLDLDLDGRPLFRVIPLCPKRTDTVRTHDQTLVVPTQTYDSDPASSSQVSLNSPSRPATIEAPVKETLLYTTYLVCV